MSSQPSAMPRQQNYVSSLLGLLALALLLPLAAHAYLGTYARYISDDFCTAWILTEKGILKSQVYWYTGWSGRYSFFLFINLLEGLGPRVAQILPGFSLLAWSMAFMLLLRGIARSINVQLRGLSIVVIGSAAVYAIVDGVPNTFQSIYWLTGISTYTIPLIFGMFYGNWLISQARLEATSSKRRITLGLSALIAFMLGGFSETYVSIQTTMLGMAFIIVLWYRQAPEAKRLRGILLSGIAGSIVSMIVILIAPGTGVRTSLVSSPANILVILQQSMLDLKIFLSIAWRSQLPLLLISGIIPGLLVLADSGTDPILGWKSKQAPLWIMGAILPPLLMLLTMLASIVPYEYAVSSYPDARVLITTQAIMMVGIVVWSLILGAMGKNILGSRYNQLNPWILAGLVVVLGSTVFLSRNSVAQALAGIGEMRYYADSWDQRDTSLRKAAQDGLDDVSAASLNHMGGLGEIGFDPNGWINQCVAQYYELNSVIAK
ncbi:MAG: hypothetical protein E4G99_13500 [Anaerolineales bacterium]|nr:MAG: hypothetical protein E4G99_13500 [Anaerolineales bacterium]